MLGPLGKVALTATSKLTCFTPLLSAVWVVVTMLVQSLSLARSLTQCALALPFAFTDFTAR